MYGDFGGPATPKPAWRNWPTSTAPGRPNTVDKRAITETLPQPRGGQLRQRGNLDFRFGVPARITTNKPLPAEFGRLCLLADLDDTERAAAIDFLDVQKE